jgi:tRNA(Met) cytidine acetyltransferase
LTALKSEDLLPLLPQLHGSQQRVAIVCHDNLASLANHPLSDHWYEFTGKLPYSKSLIVSDCIVINDAADGVDRDSNSVHQLSAKKVKRLLGDEYDCVLFDARSDFDLDALGVVSGLIRGGGCLLLLLPDVSVWQEKNTAFYIHLRGMLVQQPGVFYLQPTIDLTHQVVFPINASDDQGQFLPCKTQDQYQLLQDLFSEVMQQSRLCHVLLSGRGRGKSSLLGLLAAKLLQQMKIKIIIMAPARSTTDPFFYHLLQQCEGSEGGRSVVHYGESEVTFMAPDALLEALENNETNSADLLLVDEAAAIPQSMLSILLQHYDKLIFSTTTHGYEGTGRGFVLKFFKLLDQVRPDWKKSELHQPVRWQQDDWLEQWIESLLFLDLRPGPALPDDFSRDDLLIEQLDPLELVKDQNKMQSVFSLLVSAHYRTRPSDFAYLLDSDDVRLYALSIDSMVVAVLAINQEGGFSPELSTQVYRGVRRPQGHLLAQTLCFHGGIETAAQLNYARIMRIAVHPHMQRMGLGGFLLNSVIKSESRRGMDVIGCSFSAEPGLVEFWRAAGFLLLRVGFSRDHVSASYALVMGAALTAKAQRLFSDLQQRLVRNLPAWLSVFLPDMHSDLKNTLRELVAGYKSYQASEAFSSCDLEDVTSFANYYRNYAACWPAISRMINQFAMLVDELHNDDKMMLYASVQYANDWPAIVKLAELSGRGEAEKRLRDAVRHLLAVYLQNNNASMV